MYIVPKYFNKREFNESDIHKSSNVNNDEGSHSDASIDKNSKYHQDDLSLPDERLFVWEIKRPHLDPLETAPFDQMQQNLEKQPDQSLSLDKERNQDDDKKSNGTLSVLQEKWVMFLILLPLVQKM